MKPATPPRKAVALAFLITAPTEGFGAAAGVAADLPLAGALTAVSVIAATPLARRRITSGVRLEARLWRCCN
jgi:hypothetical protein